MSSHAVFIHNPGAADYCFGEEHPFNPIRLSITCDLLETLGALSPHERLLAQSPPCREELLSLVHRQDYIEAVQQLSRNQTAAAGLTDPSRYGLDTNDTPCFTGMHEAAAAIVSGSVLAAEQVMSGEALHAYHMAGGLHHAFPDRGAGFCIYNDAAVAIRHIREKYGARVLYIDTDVHHGDGVQWVFYDDPDVFTYSIHETGKYLFPGTGYVHEKGTDQGFGACINVPLEPYTEDDSWMESFQSTITRVAEAFKPDIIVSQHGCDAHAYDPLSHIHCSMRIYQEMPALIHQLAHQYAEGRWVALGGGGYDIWQVVPRAWSLVWLTMTEHPLLSELAAPGAESVALPEQWRTRWAEQGQHELPEYWLDQPDSIPPIPRREEITGKNRETQSIILHNL
ncbi:acetoin utilization protein AcuC [Paenibacillus sp. GCM10023252]|uniref:acetoin utilization protein AcuC n=1 Tax=Paenibacillus sp. GCM10023252 TaxID=3252649 RepID=UPI0036203575